MWNCICGESCFGSQLLYKLECPSWWRPVKMFKDEKILRNHMITPVKYVCLMWKTCTPSQGAWKTAVYCYVQAPSMQSLCMRARMHSWPRCSVDSFERDARCVGFSQPTPKWGLCGAFWRSQPTQTNLQNIVLRTCLLCDLVTPSAEGLLTVWPGRSIS